MKRALTFFLIAFFRLLLFTSPAYAAIVINEVLPDPVGADAGNEWVELYNTDGGSISIAGYVLEDNNGDRMTLSGEITTWLVIKQQGSFGLTNTGSTIKLFSDNTSTDPIDAFTYGSSSEGKSWGRIPDGGSIYGEKLTPTEGSANVVPSPSPSPNPSLSPSPSPTPTPTPAPSPTPKPSPTPTPKSTPKPSQRPSPSPRSEAETPSGVEGPSTSPPKVLGVEASPTPSPEPKKSFSLTKSAIVSYSLVGSGLLFILAAGIPLLLRHFSSRHTDQN